MEYINAQELLNRVKARLSSYFSTHRANEAMLYPPLLECLSQMGVGKYEEDNALLEVKGSQVELPENFHQLCYAVGCFEFEFTRPVPNVGTQERRVEACAVDIQKGFDVQIGPNGLQKIIQYLPLETWSWSDFEVLRTVQTRSALTSENCPNIFSNSQNEIRIENGKIYTNFETGTIYIEYLKTPITAQGIKVPDHPKILKWIEEVLTYEVLYELYLNGEPDIQQRMQIALQRSTVAEMRAMSVYKRSEFQDFYSLRNRLMRRYKALAKPMMTNEYRHHRPGY